MTVFSELISEVLSDAQEQMSAADMMNAVVGDLLGVRRADVCQAVNHRRGRFGGFCIFGSDPSGVFKPSFCTF